MSLSTSNDPAVRVATPKTVMDQDSTAKHYLHPNRVSTWKRLIIDGIADVFSGGKQVGLTETEFKNFELLPENRTLT